MSLDDRIGYFLLGCFLGFVLGLMVAYLRSIKETVDEVDAIVKRTRDEGGYVRNPVALDVAFLLVVLVTVWAAIASQNASNKSNDTSSRVVTLQGQQQRNLDCTTQIVFDAVTALNDRTTYSGDQADANISLVQAQFDLITKGQNPKLSLAEQKALFRGYINEVDKFLEVAKRNQAQQAAHPYPTAEDLTKCLSKAQSKNSKE